MQHEIEMQEQKLRELDNNCMNDPDDLALMNDLSWDKHPDNPHPGRAAVIERLQPLLHKYNEHITVYSQLRSHESARKYQVKNLENWFRSRSNPEKRNSGPVKDAEQSYLSTGTDLICITPRHKTPLARLLETSSLVRWMLEKPLRPGQVEYREVVYYSDKKLRWLSDIITIVIGLIMLYGPMWWLNYVSGDAKRLAIITVFVFFFAVGLSLIGSGRPFETLAATAAYAAVLMVFMQRQGSNAK